MNKPCLFLCEVALDLRNGAAIRMVAPYLEKLGNSSIISLYVTTTAASASRKGQISYWQSGAPTAVLKSLHLCFKLLRLRFTYGSDIVVHCLPNSWRDLLPSVIATFLFRRTVCYFMDDFGSSKGSRISRLLEMPLTALLYRRAQTSICVSGKMAEEYQRRYRRPADLLLCKSWPLANFLNSKHEGPRAGRLRIVWIGTFQTHYLATLKSLALILSRSASDEICLHLYSQKPPPAHFPLSENCQYMGFIADVHLLNTLGRYDYGLVTYSFDQHTQAFMKFSFPSKMADYACSGLPSLIIAPASLSFLAIPEVTSTSQICNSQNAADIADLLKRAQSLSSTDYVSASLHVLQWARRDFCFDEKFAALERLIRK
jgi:hypothetical protein